MNRILAICSLLLACCLAMPGIAQAEPPQGVVEDPQQRLAELAAEFGLDDPAACDLPEAVEKGQGYITGFFTFYESDLCEALAKMQGVYEHGGDTMITFGFRLTERDVDDDGRILNADGEVDPRFDCRDGEESCVDSAAAAAGDAEIRRVLTYSGAERFGDGMLQCDGLDRNIVSGGERFQLVLLPVGEGGCNADSFDVVLIANGPDSQASDVATTLVAAEMYDIEMYLGYPRPTQNPDSPWLIDVSYMDTTEVFTKRVLQDWERRYADLDSFHGHYQSTEMPPKGNDAWDDQFVLYDTQHAVSAEVAPDRPILVSPYIDARPSMTSPVSAVELFVERLVASGDGSKIILAPQDGRGTGKGGVYFPDQADDVVIDRLQDVVGGPLTYSEAFGGTTSHDYFAEALRVGEQVAGENFELWANIELMEPAPLDGEPICIPGVDRGQADSDRIATQVSVAGTVPSKLIGFDWDQAMLCEVPGKDILRDQLKADEGRPLPTGLDLEPTGTAVLYGYHLDDVSGSVTWASTDGGSETVQIDADRTEFFEDAHDVSDGRYPAGLNALRFPLHIADTDNSQPWVSIDLENEAGTIAYGTYRVVPERLAPACSVTVDEDHRGPLRLDGGMVCVSEATVSGPVTITGGGSILLDGASVTGPVRVEGGGSVTLIDTSVEGPVSITDGAGSVTVINSAIYGPLALDRSDVGARGVGIQESSIDGPLKCGVDTDIYVDAAQVNGPVGSLCSVED